MSGPRFRIDIAVRELDVPEDQARGVRVGQEVDLDSIYAFFVDCRNALVTILGAPRPKPTASHENEAYAVTHKPAEGRPLPHGPSQAPLPPTVYYPPNPRASPPREVTEDAFRVALGLRPSKPSQ